MKMAVCNYLYLFIRRKKVYEKSIQCMEEN